MATNLEAVQSGSRRAVLQALAETLAAQLDTTDSNVHAQIAAQLRATVKELAELPVEDDESATQAARRKRAERRKHLKAV